MVSSINDTHDEAGNDRTMEDPGIAGNNWRFGYDGIDRLNSAAGLSDLLSGPNILYDGRGNLLAKAIGAGRLSYTYDASTDRVTRVEGIRQIGDVSLSTSDDISYDRYGNITGREGVNVRYNDAQQMVCHDCGRSGQSLDSYDGAGLRLQTQSGTRSTYFVHSNAGNLMWETDGTTGETEEYFYVAGKQVAVRRVRQ